MWVKMPFGYPYRKLYPLAKIAESGDAPPVPIGNYRETPGDTAIKKFAGDHAEQCSRVSTELSHCILAHRPARYGIRQGPRPTPLRDGLQRRHQALLVNQFERSRKTKRRTEPALGITDASELYAMRIDHEPDGQR
jgi:hypothetical protein